MRQKDRAQDGFPSAPPQLRLPQFGRLFSDGRHPWGHGFTILSQGRPTRRLATSPQFGQKVKAGNGCGWERVSELLLNLQLHLLQIARSGPERPVCWASLRGLNPLLPPQPQSATVVLSQFHFNLFGFGVYLGDFEAADLALAQGFRLCGSGGSVAFPAGFQHR